MNKKISIIVPVYKSEKFISKCIYSLVNQTIDNIEILVVDDKGNDNSIEIVQEIKAKTAKNDLIKIVEMPVNSGAAAARNCGMKNATGEFIAFVDSDDWCEPQMFEKLYEKAKQNNSDWAFANAVKNFEAGKTKSLKQTFVEDGRMTCEKQKKIITNHAALFWSGIYNREFLIENNIYFEKFKFSEDSVFFWNVVLSAENFSYIDADFYHYMAHPGSVTNIYDETMYLQKINIFQKFIQDTRKNGKYLNLAAELDFLYIKKGFFLPLIILEASKIENKKQEIKNIYKDFCNIVPNYRKNIYYKRNIKLRMLLFLFLNFNAAAGYFSRIILKRNTI